MAYQMLIISGCEKLSIRHSNCQNAVESEYIAHNRGKGLNANWEEVQILVAYPHSAFTFCF